MADTSPRHVSGLRRPKHSVRTLKEARQYLDAVLSMDPMVQSAEMVEMRWNYCGFAPPKTVPAKTEGVTDLRRRRELVAQQLEKIRANFWTADPEKLKTVLDRLDVRDFPELKAGVNRLQRILAQIALIEKLASHKKTEINLYNTFRRIVMMPSQSAGELKENYLRQLAGSSHHKKARSMVAMMRKEFPNLIEIESDWFEQISRAKVKSAADKVTESGESVGGFFGGMGAWGVIIVVWILLKIIFQVAFR